MMTLSKQKNFTFTSLLEDIRGSKCCIIKVRQYTRMKTINSKLKALEWLQQISLYKAMGIFPDAQGQLTPQSKV